jgi:hypothetical protein
MYTTTDERGVMNNYATEPEMYYATSPSPSQQRNYFLQGSIALILVSSIVLTALAVS